MSRRWDGHTGARGTETVRQLGRAALTAGLLGRAGAGLVEPEPRLLQPPEGADPVPVTIRARAAWRKNRKARRNRGAGSGPLAASPPSSRSWPAPRLPWLPGSSGSYDPEDV